MSAIPGCVAEVVWSAFAFVYHGERVPNYATGVGQGSLTSLGAQQMFSQGSELRRRWLINTTVSNESSNVTSNAPITGIERVAIDNDQLLLYSTTDDYLNIGALAFMQGLYPPTSQAFAYDNGGINASILANGSLVDFPLGGYMYPNIRTLSTSEAESVWFVHNPRFGDLDAMLITICCRLEGQAGCREYRRATGSLQNEPYLEEMYNSSFSHYQDLWSTVFAGVIPQPSANLDNAYDLYEFASYQYTHNETVQQSLRIDDLNWLAEMASIREFSKNGNLTVSGLQEGDMIRAISGRTLAAKVIALFQQAIMSGGTANKLNLMFGTHEPMLAFFSLSGLSEGISSELFQQLPYEGGTSEYCFGAGWQSLFVREVCSNGPRYSDF